MVLVRQVPNNNNNNNQLLKRRTDVRLPFWWRDVQYASFRWTDSPVLDLPGYHHYLTHTASRQGSTDRRKHQQKLTHQQTDWHTEANRPIKTDNQTDKHKDKQWNSRQTRSQIDRQTGCCQALTQLELNQVWPSGGSFQFQTCRTSPSVYKKYFLPPHFISQKPPALYWSSWVHFRWQGDFPADTTSIRKQTNSGDYLSGQENWVTELKEDITHDWPPEGSGVHEERTQRLWFTCWR